MTTAEAEALRNLIRATQQLLRARALDSPCIADSDVRLMNEATRAITRAARVLGRSDRMAKL